MSRATALVPLLNRVLVKKFDPASVSKGGVFLPESNQQRVTKGTVVAVGPGTTTTQGKQVPCCLKVGDKVLLPDYGGTRIQQENEPEYFLYRDIDILAKLGE